MTEQNTELTCGWLRACDEAMINLHIGVANLSDSYESAKAKLQSLIDLHITIATDPAVNGGYKLVPVEPTMEMIIAMEYEWMYGSNSDMAKREYKAMLIAAQGASND